MEPENVSDYSKVSYWNERYSKEPTYDWFNSVYDECLDKLVTLLWNHFCDSKKKQIRVLHLGTGNSRLVHDLATTWYEKANINNNNNKNASAENENETTEKSSSSSAIIDLYQVAIDYSPVVIENMQKGEQPAVGPKVEWIVADMRDLSHIVPLKQEETTSTDYSTSSPSLFDVVIDKGTMDALQADKESDTLEEDIEAMLKETSRVLSKENSLFIQVTWEVPYFRKHWVMREEYGWKNDELKVLPLNPDKETGDSLYRILKYVKKN